MKKVITEKLKWKVVQYDNGYTRTVEYVPHTPSNKDVDADYVITGYGAFLATDDGDKCTEYTVHDTKKKAKEYLKEQYDVDFDLEFESEDESTSEQLYARGQRYE